MKRCGFCAFSRTGGKSDEGYFLPLEEILRRATEAQELGATEVCVQAGLPPNMQLDRHAQTHWMEALVFRGKKYMFRRFGRVAFCSYVPSLQSCPKVACL